MATKTIKTILSLKDNMSGGIVKVSKSMENMSDEAKSASRQVAMMTNKFTSSIDKMITKSLKFAAVTATALGGLAIKTGLSEAFDLEGYRTQLETATKDTKKAADIMSYAINLANKTPFEGGEMVSSASKLESMGMDAYKWLSLSGDMAAATNKSLDQATEALIDAQTGELERLKEFGITKAMVVDKANELWSGAKVVDNSGSITDMAKFNDALVEIMKEKYTGGMEKMSKTTKGIWSTITGVTKNALAQIVGMQSDGTVKQGSLLDKLREKLSSVSEKLQQWQSDGTIQRISEKASETFTKIYDGVSKVFNFLKTHRDSISTILVVVGAFYSALKVVSAVKTAIKGLQVIWTVTNGVMALTPTGMIVLGITAVITAIYLLWKHWDEIVAFIKREAEIIKNNFAEGIAKIKAKVTGAWDDIKGVFSGIKAWIDEHVIQPIVNLVPDWVKKLFTGKASGNITVVDDTGHKNSSSRTGHNALGTSYWRGGWSIVGEHGPEKVYLPGGSKVQTASRTRNTTGETVVNLNFNVMGNLYSNDQAKHEFGEYIAKEVKLALRSV